MHASVCIRFNRRCKTTILPNAESTTRSGSSGVAVNAVSLNHRRARATTRTKLNLAEADDGRVVGRLRNRVSRSGANERVRLAVGTGHCPCGTDECDPLWLRFVQHAYRTEMPPESSTVIVNEHAGGTRDNLDTVSRPCLDVKFRELQSFWRHLKANDPNSVEIFRSVRSLHSSDKADL